MNGTRILKLFGDAVTEILIRHDGGEGRMREMNSEYLAMVRNGDYLEVRAKLVSVDRASRTFECTAHKIIEMVRPDDFAANVLAEPTLVAKATAVAVVPVGMQRVDIR